MANAASNIVTCNRQGSLWWITEWRPVPAHTPGRTIKANGQLYLWVRGETRTKEHGANKLMNAWQSTITAAKPALA